MLERLRRLRDWLGRLAPLRGNIDHAHERSVNAWSAAEIHEAREAGIDFADAEIPPGYFPRQDEGRPRT